MSYASRCGFAVMFLIHVATTSLFAQRGLPPASRSRPLPLLVSESVQKEIELTDDQRAKVNALHEKFQEAVAKLDMEMTGGKGSRDMTEEQRAKWFQGIRKINDDFEPKTREILKPEQFERAQQIAYQLQGAQAFRNPDVVKALELTAEQQEVITKVSKEYLEKVRAVFTDDSLGTPEKTASSRKLRDDHTAEVAKLLTKEQTEKWVALKGKPFDILTIRLARQPKADEKKP